MQKQARATSKADPTTGKPTGALGAARSPEADPGPDACQCGYLEGTGITYTDTNTATGETEQKSFRKPSKKLICPHCGGRNSRYRNSYIAHVASIARTHEARKGIVWDVSLCLDAEAVSASEVGREASVSVWFQHLWPRLRKRLVRADENVKYIGTASAQLSNGRYHFHLVVFSTLPGYRIRELLHKDPGVDCYVQCPAANESNEEFAARRSAYAWDNAARAARACLDRDVRGYRFTASQGVGYSSASAKARRLKAVRASGASRPNSERNTSALIDEHGQTEKQKSVQGQRDEQNSPLAAPDRPPEARGSPPESSASTEPNAEEPKASPVKYGRSGRSVRVSDHNEALSRVRAVLSGYVGRTVHVWEIGPCRVLSVGVQRVEGCRLAVTVHPVDAETTTAVPWTEVRCTCPPIIRTVSPQPPTQTANPMSKNEQNEQPENEHADAVERFLAAARYSTVTVEQEDGTRIRTRKDHETGEVTETVLPPKGE